MYSELLSYVETIPVIDSHEHLPNESERLSQQVDFFTLFSHYCIDDLAAAGMPQETIDMLLAPGDTEEKWNAFNPYYELITESSYVRCAHLAMRHFYDLDCLGSVKDAVLLTERIRAYNKKGLYNEVLKKTCNIVTAINFRGTSTDREFFTPVTFVTQYAEVNSPASLLQIEKETGYQLTSLQRYAQALGAILERERDRGTKGIKFHFAYMRPLNFETVTTADAERVFNRIMDEGQGWRTAVLGYDESRPLQDYLVHRLVERAVDLDLTVVFHVGFQARPYMKLPDTRPGQLWSLLNRFRNARFNMLHAGIPWMDEAAIMAKHFPNLYLDMGWTHAMSPELSYRAIKSYVDLLPRNKVIGFGGDYGIVEKVFGHLTLARENISRALSQKVTEGAISDKAARKWAQALLYNNPIEAYKLDIQPLLKQ